MNYCIYNLPRNHNKITNVSIHKFNEIMNEPFINKSLFFYLQQAKKQIQKHNKNWDNYKKLTNPLEFLHTQCRGRTVAQHSPISRAYFKFIEIYIQSHIQFNHSINSFHLAEGPGGFIEALSNIRNNMNDTYYGMTLINKSDKYIPSWKKSKKVLINNPRIKLEYGSDNTGDLYSYNNLKYCRDKYFNTMDLITGDGGFDFSINYEHQEQMIWKLLFAQLIYALTMQKQDGVFILKCFDIFHYYTIEIIYLCTCFYRKVSIYKPKTSRLANSEKYLICKGFERDKVDLDLFYNIYENVICLEKPCRLLNIHFPYIFISKLIEINATYGQQQIENIYFTLNLIKEPINEKNKERVEKKLQKHINNCIEWCKYHNQPYNYIPNFKLWIQQIIFNLYKLNQ